MRAVVLTAAVAVLAGMATAVPTGMATSAPTGMATAIPTASGTPVVDCVNASSIYIPPGPPTMLADNYKTKIQSGGDDEDELKECLDKCHGNFWQKTWCKALCWIQYGETN